MKNIKTMLQRCHAMCDTKDISEWQNNFLKSLWNQTAQGTVTASLSPKQIDSLGSIYDRHFSG